MLACLDGCPISAWTRAWSHTALRHNKLGVPRRQVHLSFPFISITRATVFQHSTSSTHPFAQALSRYVMSSASVSAVDASPEVHELLKRLHAASEAQERSISQILFYISRIARYYLWGETWSSSADNRMRDKFVSLESDKCQFVYLLARSIGAQNIVEAGTSFGVSTIYLALAVGQNVAKLKSDGVSDATGKVVATEKEPSKAARAREHWKEAGPAVEPWIELREGDLLDTLKDPGIPETVDLLLLDSKFLLVLAY